MTRAENLPYLEGKDMGVPFGIKAHCVIELGVRHEAGLFLFQYMGAP